MRERTDYYDHSPGCFVYQDVTINYGNVQDQPTLMAYDSFLWNDNGAFDFGVNGFRCQRAGRLSVGCGVLISTLGTTNPISYFLFDVRKNDSALNLKQLTRIYQYNSLPETFLCITGVTVLEVDVGDIITSAFSTGHTAFVRSGGTSNFFQCYYLT